MEPALNEPVILALALTSVELDATSMEPALNEPVIFAEADEVRRAAHTSMEPALNEPVIILTRRLPNHEQVLQWSRP